MGFHPVPCATDTQESKFFKSELYATKAVSETRVF